MGTRQEETRLCFQFLLFHICCLFQQLQGRPGPGPTPPTGPVHVSRTGTTAVMLLQQMLRTSVPPSLVASGVQASSSHAPSITEVASGRPACREGTEMQRPQGPRGRFLPRNRPHPKRFQMYGACLEELRNHAQPPCSRSCRKPAPLHGLVSCSQP